MSSAKRTSRAVLRPVHRCPQLRPTLMKRQKIPAICSRPYQRKKAPSRAASCLRSLREKSSRKPKRMFAKSLSGRLSNVSAKLVGQADAGSNIAGIRHLVEHERRDICPRNAHGPQPMTHSGAVAVVTALGSVGEHARAHDRPVKIRGANDGLLARLVPQISRQDEGAAEGG